MKTWPVSSKPTESSGAGARAASVGTWSRRIASPLPAQVKA